ncbi:hypothetical protein Lal_00018484 [Lupinus albus]|nr:hypothetical protein Lal_00018484 [Lupinus albus]
MPHPSTALLFSVARGTPTRKKFLRKKGGLRKFHKEDAKDSIKKSKYSKGISICLECGKVGYMKYTCPTYLKMNEHNNKEDSRDIKAKKAYIIWDAPEEDTTSTSTLEDEESNMFTPNGSKSEFLQRK